MSEASHPDIVPADLHVCPGREVRSALIDDGARFLGAFRNLNIASNFQPIFSLAHQRVVGFEGLMRAATAQGHIRSPLEVLASAAGQAEIVFLDRLCRAVHLRNYLRQDTGNTWLFLNINPRVIVESGFAETFFREELELVGLPPHRVVIEILETAQVDEGLLMEAVSHYRALGCLIAIDDFGAGHSNFDRIGRLCPDIVKLDRSIIVQATGDRSIHAIVPGMVSLLHEAGSLVVMEGIETEREAMIAMDADTDFVQGRYFAPPVPWASVRAMPAFDRLFDQFRQAASRDSSGYRSEIAPYLNGLGYASVLLGSGHPLEVACQGFLELPRAERCFLLDGSGRQIGENVNAPGATATASLRYEPLRDGRGANWSRRHYFRRAIARPGKVQITRPYLSAASATPCVTASIAFKVRGEQCVLCGDIRWEDHHALMDHHLIDTD